LHIREVNVAVKMSQRLEIRCLGASPARRGEGTFNMPSKRCEGATSASWSKA
jgi:hypothetical protein